MPAENALAAAPSLPLTQRMLRLARTLAQLHPWQLAARPWHLLAPRARVALLGSLPHAAAAELRREAPAALATHLARESERGRSRLERLARGSALRDFEAAYGAELGVDDEVSAGRWTTRTGLHPFVASVRARRLALRAALGGSGHARALSQAAYAVASQPELHLLGNHLLENALALLCAGAALEGRLAELCEAPGRALFTATRGQWLADGGHSERSASYHLALTAAMLETHAVRECFGAPPLVALEAVARAALGWARAVRAPDGTYPLFNDAALDAAPSLDAVLELGAALFGALPPAPEAAALREHTGWLVHEGAECFLAVDAGPDGDPWQPGHVHADASTFVLWLRGEPAVVDVGVSAYGEDPARRAFCRGSRAHNVVELAGSDSAEVWGAFRTGRRCTAWVEGIAQEGETLRATIAHNGYRWLRGKPTLRRRFHLEGRSLRVEDEVRTGLEATSHLWLDATLAARGAFEVSGEAPLEREEGAWFPRHGEARSALHLAQRLPSSGGARRGAWLLTW